MRRTLFLLILFVATIARADDLRVDTVRESLTATHTRYQQFIDGIPVLDGERVVSADHAGRRTVTDALAHRNVPLVQALIAPARRGDLVYVNIGGEARLAVREIAEERPLERYARYYDAVTGNLLRVDALFFRVSARVFDPNPVAKLNNPSLQDGNNSAAAVPAAAYTTVDVAGLAQSGPLIGPNVQIVDTAEPFTNAHADASQPLNFDRSQLQFEEVNAYFHIDRSQRYLQSLGYIGPRRVVAYSIPVDAHAAGGTDNSFYVGSIVRGQGALFFGDGGTDDAEDADIMIHEFAHAIHDWIAPDAFNGTSASESRAMAEGFADYWSFSQQYAQTIASGRDPFCLGDWDARCWNDDPSQKCGYPAGSDCLRRVDGAKTLADFIASTSPGTEHQNGEIWSSALREIFLTMTARYGFEQGRRLSDTIVVESFFGAPSHPTFAGQARKLLDADLWLNRGEDLADICRSLTTRGILSIGDCGAPPRGELTLFQSSTSVLHVSQAGTIEDVLARVQIDGAKRGDIRVTLVAPDGTSIVLEDGSTMVAPDVTFGLDAVPVQSLTALRGRDAVGDWTLVIEPLRSGVTARLRSWSLLLRFSGDAPAASRPRGSSRKIIGAVAHVVGAANTSFISDVQIYNRGNFPLTVTAIFTPSGADGRSRFAAIRLNIEAKQLVTLNDVVRTTMQSSGLGQLELLAVASGDGRLGLLGGTRDMVITSRTYTPAGDATFGQTIPALGPADAGGDQIFPLQNSTAFRSNIGVAEVDGGSGVARFTFLDRNGNSIGSADYDVLPFGHLQARVPVAGTDMRAVVSVISGDARVLAYGSVVDNLSGDAIYIPAIRRSNVPVAIPVINSAGANGTNWRTEIATLRGEQLTLETVNVTGVGVRFLDGPASSRTYTTSAAGTFGQYVPPLEPAPAGATIDMIGIEQSARFRTNAGVINFSDQPASVTWIVYDAAGGERGRTVTAISPRSLQQLPLTAIVSGTLPGGRIEIRSSAPAAAYASVIDSGSEDPSLIAGQY